MLPFPIFYGYFLALVVAAAVANWHKHLPFQGLLLAICAWVAVSL